MSVALSTSGAPERLIIIAIDMAVLLPREESLLGHAGKFIFDAWYLCKNARMIDWQDIHFLSLLARTGSLSAAAREVKVDHATVSRRIASLEDALAVRLVVRRPRSIGLTPQGEAIAALASTMAETVRIIERTARSYADPLIATVKITAPPALAARLIAPQIGRFYRAYPRITPILSGVSHHAALDRGEADVAVRLARPTESDLVVRRIGVMRFALYATPEIAAKPSSQWTFIGYDAALSQVTQQVWLLSLLEGRPVVFQASDLFGQQEAARAGLGAVVLPCFMGDDDPALVRLPVNTPPPTRDIWLATYRDILRAPATRAVLDFLAEVIGERCAVGGAEAQRLLPED